MFLLSCFPGGNIWKFQNWVVLAYKVGHAYEKCTYVHVSSVIVFVVIYCIEIFHSVLKYYFDNLQ